MRCVIARYPFDLTKSGVLDSMKGVAPELVTGESVTSGEVVRALTRLGFTCHEDPGSTPATVLTPLQAASALLSGAAASGDAPAQV
jgi:hypothetical protein